MSTTQCRVWEMFQPRCRLCGWSGEVTGNRHEAADSAQDHRRSDEHRKRMAEEAYMRAEPWRRGRP